MSVQTPEWVKHAVFYQIFPDRFARSPRIQHPRGIQFKPWGSPPSEQGFQGGDLYGVIDHLDYLEKLGVNALYFNPIFASAANHRYHTFDYLQVDPLLGGNAAFRELLDEAHKRDMKIILDGVFNHASRGFWPFHHILENGKNSPYLDWFRINGWPLRPYHPDEQNPANYEAWWGLSALPKFNTNNPGVRDYIMQVAKHWIEFGIDGWRLDVPAEIKDDNFWREFRRVVKTANPEAYICGEIWGPAQHWLQGDQFDAVMNYVFTGATISFFGKDTLNTQWVHPELNIRPQDAATFAARIEAMHHLYDWQINYAQLNLLDSHDMPRALWLMNNDKEALRLAVLFQMTMPGAPCIYYGDEIGLSAGPDPECREAFPWDVPERWDHDLLSFYRAVTALRRQYPVLRTGDYQTLYAAGDVLAFQRSLSAEQVFVMFNIASSVQHIELIPRDTPANSLKQAWPLQTKISFKQRENRVQITLPPRSGIVLST